MSKQEIAQRQRAAYAARILHNIKANQPYPVLALGNPLLKKK